jgi:hypothetical protein
MIWRMIYNNSDVIDLFYTDDITITSYNIFEGETKYECFKKIDELRLNYYYNENEDGSIIIFSDGNRTIIEKNELK